MPRISGKPRIEVPVFTHGTHSLTASLREACNGAGFTPAEKGPSVELFGWDRCFLFCEPRVDVADREEAIEIVADEFDIRPDTVEKVAKPTLKKIGTTRSFYLTKYADVLGLADGDLLYADGTSGVVVAVRQDLVDEATFRRALARIAELDPLSTATAIDWDEFDEE